MAEASYRLRSTRNGQVYRLNMAGLAVRAASLVLLATDDSPVSAEMESRRDVRIAFQLAKVGVAVVRDSRSWTLTEPTRACYCVTSNGLPGHLTRA